ncbi:hypothetical protein [uncultured Veillonella sp.]|uniref:hypothetical protein n=1 Tax=uncultured Veillonella sp. TaxID=159268 RepID=UPI0025924393|nr:hypothetical protein [uncultured Veillonella sp.]
MKYYYFNKDGNFVMVMDELVEFESPLTVIPDETIYVSGALHLVDGKIVEDEVVNQEVDIEENIAMDSVREEALEAIIGLSEIITVQSEEIRMLKEKIGDE